MLIKFVRSIQQKVGMGFLSTDFRKYFRKAILWIEELVQADNEQLLPEKMKTLKSSSTQETRTKSAGALVNRFRKIRSKKDFTLDFPLNSQNSRDYGFKNNENI